MIRILIDMNLSPDWAAVFSSHGIAAVHWGSIGNASAPDTEIMAWARDNGYVVFTHDLDFGTLLAMAGAKGPSVVQVRCQDILPSNVASLVLQVIQKHEAELAAGAIMVIDAARARLRLLPIS